MHLDFDGNLGPPPVERAIFVVDDDPNDHTLFLHALQEAGIANPCRFFSTGNEMVDALIAVLQGAPRPLVCFLDVKMAGMNGLDVLRWIRLQDPLAEVAVVMMSSSQEPASLNEACRYGAQCYAAKFPDAAQLREIVSEAGRFAVVASGRSSFNLPCNLLLAAHLAVS